MYLFRTASSSSGVIICMYLSVKIQLREKVLLIFVDTESSSMHATLFFLVYFSCKLYLPTTSITTSSLLYFWAFNCLLVHWARFSFCPWGVIDRPSFVIKVTFFSWVEKKKKKFLMGSFSSIAQRLSIAHHSPIVSMMAPIDDSVTDFDSNVQLP